MSDAVYLVTGSTDGIGQHTAQRLAATGATVLVHGRNPKRVEAAVARIKAAARNDKVQGYAYDLASFEEVQALARHVTKDHPKIDVLINNAGVFQQSLKKSADGFELTWAVNVLAPFLLTRLLLDSVSKRVVNVASISAASHIDFANLNQERGFSGHSAYSLSKLASILFTYQLAPRLAPRGVTANCLDPGTVNTKMLYAGWGPCGIDVQDADDEFFLATDPSVEGVTGKYYVHSRQRQSPSVSYEVAVQERLWAVLEEQTGVTYHVDGAAQ